MGEYLIKLQRTGSTMTGAGGEPQPVLRRSSTGCLPPKDKSPSSFASNERVNHSDIRVVDDVVQDHQSPNHSDPRRRSYEDITAAFTSAHLWSCVGAKCGLCPGCHGHVESLVSLIEERRRSRSNSVTYRRSRSLHSESQSELTTASPSPRNARLPIESLVSAILEKPVRRSNSEPYEAADEITYMRSRSLHGEPASSTEASVVYSPARGKGMLGILVDEREYPERNFTSNERRGSTTAVESANTLNCDESERSDLDKVDLLACRILRFTSRQHLPQQQADHGKKCELSYVPTSK